MTDTATAIALLHAAINERPRGNESLVIMDGDAVVAEISRAQIAAILETLRNGGERAKVVAYIRSLNKGLLAMLPNTQRRLADAIEAGEHMGGGHD